MELVENKCKIRCEMGACNHPATRVIKMRRVGIGSHLHVCDECLKELYGLIGETIIPKSIETVKKEKRK